MRPSARKNRPPRLKPLAIYEQSWLEPGKSQLVYACSDDGDPTKEPCLRADVIYEDGEVYLKLETEQISENDQERDGLLRDADTLKSQRCSNDDCEEEPRCSRQIGDKLTISVSISVSRFCEIGIVKGGGVAASKYYDDERLYVKLDKSEDNAFPMSTLRNEWAEAYWNNNDYMPKYQLNKRKSEVVRETQSNPNVPHNDWRGEAQLIVEGRVAAQSPSTPPSTPPSSSGSQTEKHPYRAENSESKSGSQLHDIKIDFHFSPGDATLLCCGYEVLEEVKKGLEKGLKLHVPPSRMKLIREDQSHLWFSEAHLEDCVKNGVDQLVCVPSGGDNRYEKAYLDYSAMLPEDKPHVLLIFVKPRDVQQYRNRYPQHILVELPPDSDKLFVGDARFWIRAFGKQLQLNAAHNSGYSKNFFSRVLMLDDDVTELYERDGDNLKPATLHGLVQIMREKLRQMEQKPHIVGFHCRGLHKPSNVSWVINGPTALGTMMSISMDANVQFHPYAQLAEDSYGAACL